MSWPPSSGGLPFFLPDGSSPLATASHCRTSCTVTSEMPRTSSVPGRVAPLFGALRLSMVAHAAISRIPEVTTPIVVGLGPVSVDVQRYGDAGVAAPRSLPMSPRFSLSRRPGLLGRAGARADAR